MYLIIASTSYSLVELYFLYTANVKYDTRENVSKIYRPLLLLKYVKIYFTYFGIYSIIKVFELNKIFRRKKMYKIVLSKINVSRKLFSKITACLLLTAIIISGSPCRAYTLPYMELSSYNQVRNRYTNMIYYNFKIKATEDLDLSKLEIGYIFTENSSIPTPNFYCDYAGVIGNRQNNNITSKVNGTVYDYSTPKSPAYSYVLLISFDEDAGIVYKNSTLEVKVRMAKPDWSLFDQSNDWSFNPNATYYDSNWDRYYIYYDGTHIY